MKKKKKKTLVPHQQHVFFIIISFISIDNKFVVDLFRCSEFILFAYINNTKQTTLCLFRCLFKTNDYRNLFN